jgi:hypothetical protein
MRYMKGPQDPGEDSGDESSGAEDEAAPNLPLDLRVSIPEASLRYLLIHHLALSYQYTKMNAWIGKDRQYNEHGVEGTLAELSGAGLWTRSDSDCLQIEDMEGTGTAEELAEEEQAREQGEEQEGGVGDICIQVAAAHLGGADQAPIDVDETG